jgi:D-arabinose 5-phosphate isomerase GutQ
LFDENFADATQEIYHLKGEISVTGIGKKRYHCTKNGGHI